MKDIFGAIFILYGLADFASLVLSIGLIGLSGDFANTRIGLPGETGWIVDLGARWVYVTIAIAVAKLLIGVAMFRDWHFARHLLLVTFILDLVLRVNDGRLWNLAPISGTIGAIVTVSVLLVYMYSETLRDAVEKAVNNASSSN